MPRYVPTKSWSQEVDEAFEAEVEAERKRLEGLGVVAEVLARRRLAIREIDPYADARSPYSYFLDRAAAALPAPDVAAVDRLARHRAAAEKEQRAITSTTLGGIVPIEPLWVREALEEAVRSRSGSHPTRQPRGS